MACLVILMFVGGLLDLCVCLAWLVVVFGFAFLACCVTLCCLCCLC